MSEGKLAEALSPCPFCGTKPEIDYMGNDATPKRKVVIRCPECCAQRTDAALRHSMKWLESVAVKNWNRRARAAQAGVPDVDDLAQLIRCVDGDHSLGAGQLAEEICEWLTSRAADGDA